MVRRFVFRTATGWWIVPIGLICRRSPLLGLAEGKGTGTIEEGTRNFHAATLLNCASTDCESHQHPGLLAHRRRFPVPPHSPTH